MLELEYKNASPFLQTMIDFYNSHLLLMKALELEDPDVLDHPEILNEKATPATKQPRQIK